MTKINFSKHPLTKRKEKADDHARNCTLLNKSFEFPTCAGYDNKGECKYCEVPIYYKKAQKNLTRLLLNGFP